MLATKHATAADITTMARMVRPGDDLGSLVAEGDLPAHAVIAPRCNP